MLAEPRMFKLGSWLFSFISPSDTPTSDHAKGALAPIVVCVRTNPILTQDIPRAKAVVNYMFDWRALRRWRMKESNLPPGSIVLNRPPSSWELYKKYVLFGIL